jgi:hypothetical protein
MMRHIGNHRILMLTPAKLLLHIKLLKTFRPELPNLLISRHINAQPRRNLQRASELRNGRRLLLPELFVEFDGHGGWDDLDVGFGAGFELDEQLGVELLGAVDVAAAVDCVGGRVVALHEVDCDDVEADVGGGELFAQVGDFGGVVFCAAGAMGEHEQSFIELLGTYMSIQFLHSEPYCLKQIPTRQPILDLGHEQILHMPHQIQAGLLNLMQHQAIPVIGLVIAEQGNPDLMVGVIEELLLEGEVDAFEGHLEPRHVLREGLGHEVAVVDAHHDGLFVCHLGYGW